MYLYMIVLTSEITDEISFGQWDHHLHICPQMKQARQSALVKRTSRIRALFFRL